MKYDQDILEAFAESKQPTTYPSVEVSMGLVVEDRSSGFCGHVVRWNHEAVTLRALPDPSLRSSSGPSTPEVAADRRQPPPAGLLGDGKQHLRHFTWKPGGFLLEGRPVSLVRPTQQPTATERITSSGSVAGDRGRVAQVAKASRIWVEGKHDADLLEHVWGDDLRELGIVVEPLHGADDLAAAVSDFRPGDGRRLGILLDHLVDGSKESRIAATVDHPAVLITGHPFVDVWAGIRPKVIGRTAWPEVPKGQPWKEGVCAALGVRYDGFWPALRNRVTTYADLEPEVVGAVEQLIDFVAPT
ncbi:DUF3097 family protein [Ilumatobacter sp.]|uniref:DUF3097 family protein n=1 Tax=Ilumatobacter sp. TaxID=1967498 RepID=UPI003AF8EA41